MKCEEMIPDYLNGHLEPEQKLLFEQAVRDEPSLARMVEQEHHWQKQVRSNVDRKMPRLSFDTLAPKINRTSIWSVDRWVYGCAAAVLIVATMLVYIPEPVAEFQTLSSPLPAYDQNVIRIIVGSSADMDAIASEFEAHVLATHRAAFTLDISATQLSEGTKFALEHDPRVRLLQLITSP